MYSSYSAAAFALRAAKPSLHAHSSYSYLYHPPSPLCHRDDADEHRHHHHNELIPQSPYLAPRFLLDGCLLRHSAHLLLFSARLRPPPPPPPHPYAPRCCRRRAPIGCRCDGGGGRRMARQVCSQVEARGCRCCGSGAGRPDLRAGCRRLKAPECRCGSSGGRTLLGAGCVRRDVPRLVGRAVRQEVWEYEGGQWLHGRSSTECLDDWEEDEDCGYGQLEVGGMRFSRRWEDVDVDDGDRHCRDCCRRKGLESYYSGEGVYNGRRRERRDLEEGRHGFRDSNQRRWQQSEYYDDEDDLDLRQQRRRWEGRDTRNFVSNDADTRSAETRRYCDDGREYNHRRERRDFNYDDVADVRRAGRYAEDVGGFDRRRESRDFEIDGKVEMKREGRRHGNDHRYVSRHQRKSEDTYGEDVSLLRSRHWNDKEIDYDEQDLADRRYYSGVRSQKFAGTSSLHEDDSKRASLSFRSTLDARHTGQKENSASSVRWHDNIGPRTEQISEERDRRHSAGWSNDERDRYDYDDAQFVRVRDSRIGRQHDKFITEDDTRFTSSSKNTSILKHSSNADQQAAVHKDGSRKSSQKIMEISEVQDNSTEQDSRAQRYHQEDRENYTKNMSSSVQNSVKMVTDSRRQLDQHNEVNQNLVSVTDSKKNSENLNVTTNSSRNVSRASHSMRNYNEINQTDIDDISTSLQNITHVTRDKKRIVNQQVIHETDIDVQNITHVDISKIHASDTFTSRSSQSHLETRSNMNSSSSMDFINRTRSQEKEGYQNEISANDSAMVRGSQSHLKTGLYDPFHSKPSTNIVDNKSGSQEQAEHNIANASNAVVASTSGSHHQTRIDDPFQSPSAVAIGRMTEQIDLATVSSSQGPVTRNGNQVHKASTVHWSRERQGKNGQQITQVSNTEQDDEARSVFLESPQDTHHNMDLIWQQADTSRIAEDKNITGLLIESTEKASSMTNVDMGQQAAMMGSYDQEVRSETTAGSILPIGSSARQSVKESMLESAARLEKSTSFLVGRFVDELQKGVSDADATSTKKNEKSTVEGIASSSSRSRTKGPTDEMWDVQSTTSQETFKTAEKEEGSSADGATNSASQTPKNESALARKVHKSLWAYVADIIRLGFIQRGDSHDSSNKSVKKSSSNNSQSTEGWLSSQERDNDGTKKKNGSTNVKHQQLIKLHGGEQESGVDSVSYEEYLHTSTHGLQTSETVIEPQVGRSEGDLLPTSSRDDLLISWERTKQSDVGELPKEISTDDSTPTLLDIKIGHLPEHKTATSRITTEGSGEFITGKGMLAGSSSVIISEMEAGRSGDGADWIYDPSGAITPYHDPQTQAVVPDENTSTGILGPPALHVGVSKSFEEKNVVQEAPQIIKTGGKDTELKRRMFQRNKQVLKDTFDEWEEAYQRDAEQRKADELFMREALLEAQRAADIWEVPVGAVLVQNGEIIARGCNLVEDLRDSTAHAEIVCIREASNKLKTWRLADTTLYVTLEPCAMCAGAILQARIDTVVWGAPNKLLGADGSWVRLFPGDAQTSTLDSTNQSKAAGPVHPFHPKITIRRGVLSTECSEIMQQFFQLRRKKKPQSPPQAHRHGHHHPVKFFSKMHHMFGTIFCL